MIWFTADTHFGHELVRQQLRTEFVTIDEMDEYLIDQINKYVSRSDRLYHLGDFMLGGNYRERAKNYLDRINCKEIHLVYGNHDRKYLGQLFKSAKDIKRITYLGQPIVMCHYPMFSWPQAIYGSIHLYGHAHGTLENALDECMPGRLSMDVGVDAIKKLTGEYRPVSYEEIVERLKGNGW